jgi:predicted nucleic acid-binding protein
MTAQERMFELLRDYREVPMALADASLVTLAEERREALVLSLDDHFRVYVATWGRERHGFDVLP